MAGNSNGCLGHVWCAKTEDRFFFVEGVLVVMPIGNPEVEQLSAQTDLIGKYNDFSISRKSEQVKLEPDHSLNEHIGDDSEDDDFATDLSDSRSANKSDNDSKESKVIALAVKYKIAKLYDKLIRKEKLQRKKLLASKAQYHLAAEKQRNVGRMLREADISSFPFHTHAGKFNIKNTSGRKTHIQPITNRQYYSHDIMILYKMVCRS